MQEYGALILLADGATGSMGPTGEIMEPTGPLTKELAQAVFAEQALAVNV